MLTLLVSASARTFGYPVITRREVRLPNGYIYAISGGEGVQLSEDGGQTWESRNDGLPIRVVYPFDSTEYRFLNAISVDTGATDRLAVVTDSAVYVSETGGTIWDPIETSDPIRSADVFTSIAVVPGVPETYYLGTSFNALFRTRDGGESWEALDEPLGSLYRGAGFYEEIRAVAVSSVDPKRIVLVAGFGGGLFLSTDEASSWEPMDAPTEAPMLDVAFLIAWNGFETLTLATLDSIWLLEAGVWREEPRGSQELDASSKLDEEHAGRTGIYVNAAYASGERLAGHIKLLETHGMNSLVVDMKDDTGHLTYDTELEFAEELKAVREQFSLDELVEAVHDAGLYLIGRIVAFQDPLLYWHEDSMYAIWNQEDDVPWGSVPVDSNANPQREFWIDPYSYDVWEYNIGIAKELERRGVDEVQFDYVRFPSDGDLDVATFRHRREEMTKTDALESFLRLASESIEIPIGIDVFGFNGWYRMGNWIGQNLVVLSQWIDVVSPMFYPSHYPRSFLPEYDYLDRAREIYARGSLRAQQLAGESVSVRPYIQAFLIGVERDYEEDEYSMYLLQQLDGVLDSAASGFTLWNASNNYYMVGDSLLEYTKGSPAAADGDLEASRIPPGANLTVVSADP